MKTVYCCFCLIINCFNCEKNIILCTHFCRCLKNRQRNRQPLFEVWRFSLRRDFKSWNPLIHAAKVVTIWRISMAAIVPTSSELWRASRGDTNLIRVSLRGSFATKRKQLDRPTVCRPNGKKRPPNYICSSLTQWIVQFIRNLPIGKIRVF